MQDRYKDLHKKIKECNAASTVDKLVLRELESLMFASSRNMHTCFLNMLIGIFETFHFNQHFISPELTGYLNEVLKHVQNEMPYISAWAARYSRQSAFPVGKYELILDPPDSTITADMIWEHAIQKILDVSPNQILVYLNMRNQDDDHKTLGMNLRENASIKQYLNLLKELSQRGVKGEQILEHLVLVDRHGYTLGMGIATSKNEENIIKYIELINDLMRTGVSAEQIFAHLDQVVTSNFYYHSTIGLKIAKHSSETVISKYLDLLNTLFECNVPPKMIFEHLYRRYDGNTFSMYLFERSEAVINQYLRLLLRVFTQLNRQDIDRVKHQWHIDQDVYLAANSNNSSIVSTFMPAISVNEYVLMKMDKEDIFKKIKLLDSANAVHYLKQCLDKTTLLGKRFRENEGFFPVPNSSYWGLLKRINAAIKELSREQVLKLSDAPAAGMYGTPARRLKRKEREDLENKNNSIYRL